MPRRSPPHDPQQYRLDFESTHRERFALLLSAMKVAGVKMPVKALLQLVYNMTRDGGTLRWPIARLAEELAVKSKNTVRTYIRTAARLRLLSVESQIASGGQRPNALSIDWEGVRRLACSQERTGAAPAPLPERPPQPRCAPATGVQKTMSGVQILPTGVQKTLGPNKDIHSLSIPQTIPTPCAQAAPSDSVRWGRAEGFLKTKLGMAAAAAACAEMRGRGAVPDDLVALVKHFEAQPGAWGVGALYLRMKRWQPGQAAGEGWPPVSEAFALRQQRERDERERQRQLSDRESHQAEVAALRLESERLEAEFGEMLEALPAEELDELVARTFPGNELMRGIFRRDGLRNALVRELLLAELAGAEV